MKFLPPFIGEYGVFIIGGILVGYVLWVLFPVRSEIGKLSPEELERHMEGDEAALVYLDEETERLMKLLKEKYSDLTSEEIVKQAPALIQVWSELWDALVEMDLIKNKYKSFSHINVFKHPELNSRAFVLAYAGFLRQYETGLKITEWVGDNQPLITLLDQEDHFSSLRMKLTDSSELIRLNVGRLYFNAVQKKSRNENLNRIIRDALTVVDESVKEFPKLAVKNPIRALKKKSFNMWFPVQKNAAKGLSYIRVTNRDYIIKPKHLSPRVEAFEPGDIFFERREWQATNVGIPGYWTHAALYLGTLEELDAFFNEPLSEEIRKKFPTAYEAMTQTDSLGFPMRIIEAKRPGVIFNSLEFSAGGDALGVLRPARLSKDDKRTVVLNALSHFGKGYDYNFDFTTDQTVVCSELVYRAFIDAAGLNLALDEFNGRLIFSPNSFVKKFDIEWGSETPELEFVLFLDGNEKTGEVIERDETEFRTSWTRPKWHIVKDHL